MFMRKIEKIEKTLLILLTSFLLGIIFFSVLIGYLNPSAKEPFIEIIIETKYISICCITYIGLLLIQILNWLINTIYKLIIIINKGLKEENNNE